MIFKFVTQKLKRHANNLDIMSFHIQYIYRLAFSSKTVHVKSNCQLIITKTCNIIFHLDKIGMV